MKKKQRGYTIIELIMLIFAVVMAAGFFGACYVIFHFLSKFW